MDPTATPPELAARERLAHGLQQMVDEASHLLKDAQRAGGDQLNATRDKFETQLRRARAELGRLEDEAMYKARRAARNTDHAVHEHPYAAMAVAAGVGLLVGMLIARR
ncbi:DUF883 family protein [Methylibium sp.]|uniref:DUF883 family protein n=1 Tax=Methylibium sp. TaxID=2067992 RepID=UPI003D09C275